MVAREVHAKALILVLTLVVLCACGCTAKSPPTLRVVTWNIAHGRGLAESQIGLPREGFVANLEAVAMVLRDVQPQVVALQESDGVSAWSGWFDHVGMLADLCDLPYRFRGTHIDVGVGRFRLDCGTSLLADRPLVAPISRIFRTETVPSKGYVQAEIEFAGRQLIVVSVHLHPSSPAIRARQAGALVEDLSDAPQPLILMGDLNCETDEGAMTTILQGLNLRAYRPEAIDLLTFPSTDPQLRIDWILISPEFTFKHFGVMCPPHSDHCAVVADVVWRR